MTKKETFAILTEINNYWDRFEVNQKRIDAWHKVLKDHDYGEIMENLENYITNNKFAPAIADLVNPPKEERDRYIPTVEETRAYLKSREENEKEAANDPTREEKKAEARAFIEKLRRG